MGSSVVLENVTKEYGQTKALSVTNLNFDEGSFTTIVGPSGCGKSTLLNIMGGLITPSAGTVSINNVEVKGPRRETGIIFQEAALLPWRNILENAAFGLEAQKVPKAVRNEKARGVLERVGLKDFMNHYPHQLSGGMRQRVAIARVLALQPDLILADEPFGALDEQTRLVMGFELLRVVRSTGATVLFITHSIQEAILLSDRILVMSARPGEILLDIDVDLPRERDDSLLGSKRVAELTSQIWKIISIEASHTLTLGS